MNNKKVEIYRVEEGEVLFNIEGETLWATQAQMAKLFDTDLTVISRHLKNIYREGELDKKGTIAKNAIVRKEGTRTVTREVNFYNLDAIISVGYRVNSKKATNFRRWATKVLKQYVVSGVAVNERRLAELDAKRLKEVEGMMAVVRRLTQRQELDAGEANGVLEVISHYMSAFQALREFDDGFIDLSGLNKGRKKQKTLLAADVLPMIDELRRNVKGGELFGKLRSEAFEGSLAAIYQSYNGVELYPTVAEKAANLLYFVIKDHPFYDGNKRIGAFLFIVFLTINDFHLTKGGETKISDRALTAVALLVAESEPSEKELVVNLVCKLLTD